LFLFLWNYIRGYVIIEASGFSVERLINMASYRGAFVWDVQAGDGMVTMRVTVKDFRLLRECARKTGCKLKIRRKAGLPFFLFRNRKRRALLVGALLAVFAVYYMSSFIWLVEIDGPDNVNKTEIIKFLQESGVRAGLPKRGIDARSVERMLLLTFDDIIWANVNVTGTRAAVTLIAAKADGPIADANGPCDIIAACDGLITRMAVSAGTPLFGEGDVVRRGETIVTGMVEITDGDKIAYEYVRAEAAVWAKSVYEFTVDVPAEYWDREYTGRRLTDVTVTLFARDIKLLLRQIKFDNYEIITNRDILSLGKDYPLPFGYTAVEYREFTPVPRNRTVEQMERMGREMINMEIMARLGDAEILERTQSYNDNGDYITAMAEVVAVRRIDEVSYFNLPE